MIRPLIVLAVVALVASGCNQRLPRLEADTSFLVDPNDPALVDVVAEALALWQTAVPYELSLKLGGFQGEGGWVVRRAPESGHGRTSWRRKTVTVDAPARWLRVTVLHEIGHVLGHDHDVGEACADGVMGVDASVVPRDASPSKCEIGLLAALYGVELAAGSSDAPPGGVTAGE